MPSMTVSPTVATRPPSTDGIDDHLEVDVLAGRVGERRLQAVLLVGRERRRPMRTSATSRFLALAARWTRRSMIAGRSRLRPEPTTIETSWVVVGVALPPSRSSTIDWRLPAGICSSVSALRSSLARLVGAGEAEQLVLDLVERALGPGDLEQAAGVAVDAGRHALAHAAGYLPWR